MGEDVDVIELVVSCWLFVDGGDEYIEIYFLLCLFCMLKYFIMRSFKNNFYYVYSVYIKYFIFVILIDFYSNIVRYCVIVYNIVWERIYIYKL